MNAVRSFFRNVFDNFQMTPMHPTDTYGQVMTELRERTAERGFDSADRDETTPSQASSSPSWLAEFHKLYGGVWSKR